MFRRFLALAVSRCGQILNRADLAAPLFVSVPTISEWLNILEITGQIIIVPPFFENFGKRIIKSPKIYFGDSGLACHLNSHSFHGRLVRLSKTDTRYNVEKYLVHRESMDNLSI
ncbi:MAG: DUF4143 domain-containing protein [Desulfobacteraceae bacterium]|nr:MAG: DUF4143 domain-containing protein [Desulfobacteraceae bacterium]